MASLPYFNRVISSRKILKIKYIVSALIIVSIVFFYFYALNHSQNKINQLIDKGEDVYWSAAQLQLALENFYREVSILKYAKKPNQALRKSYQILLSRYFILKNTPEVTKNFHKNPIYNNVTQSMETYFSQAEKFIKQPSADEIDNIIDKTKTLARILAEFSVSARHEELIYREEYKEDSITRQHFLSFSFLIIWAMFLFILFCFIYSDRMKKEINRKNILLKREAEAREAAICAELIKTNFFASVSHEIRSPLQSILSNVQLLEVSQFRSDVYYQCLTRLKSSTEHLIYQMNDILKMAEISGGKLTITRSTVNFSKILEDVYSFHQPLCENKGITLTFHNAVDTLIISDKDRIRQILWNLVSNSVRYTDTGYIEIFSTCEIHTETPCILRISVKDSGIGIPNEYLDKIFQPFVKVTNKKREGHGLGLAITKGLVDLLSGNISIRSVVAQGTEVTVELPVVKQIGNADSLENSNKNILIVDDDKIIRETLSASLKDIGYLVDQADSIKAACELIAAKLYLAMLIDIELEDGNGHDILMFAKTCYRHHFVAIAMTAYHGYGKDNQYHDFDHLLLKPIDFIDIKKTLDL